MENICGQIAVKMDFVHLRVEKDAVQRGGKAIAAMKSNHIAAGQ
jgi:hypothetical protein